jgi:hypothetical protein
MNTIILGIKRAVKADDTPRHAHRMGLLFSLVMRKTKKLRAVNRQANEFFRSWPSEKRETP